MAASGTIYGCPISSVLAFESACSVTNVPACETANPVVYDKACCNSIEAYGSSIAECFSKSAPSCLNTSEILAASASLSGTASHTNPCAAYITGGGAVQATTSAGSASQATKTGPSGSTDTGATKSAGTSSAGASSASSSSATAKPNSAVSPVGAGLKVYIGFALIGALAVLNL